MKITAKVQTVFPTESLPTKSGGQFHKRIVWALDESNPQYPNPLEFEFTGNAISTPDRIMPGMVVEFDYAIQGNEWVSQAGKQQRGMRLRAWGVTILQNAAPQPYNPQQPQPMPQQPQYQQPAQPQAYPQQQPGGYQNVPANPYGGHQVAQPQPQYQQPAPTGYGQPQQPAGFVPPLPPQAPAGNPLYQQPTVDQRVANGDLPF